MTPPFEVPDEITHFERAFEVSSGGWISRPSGPGAGAVLPDSIPRLATELADGIPFHPERRIHPEILFRAFGDPLEPRLGAFVTFSNSALTSPIPYLPQAGGIAAARLLTKSVLAMFYAGRLANLAVSIFLTTLAVRWTPVGRPLFFLLALTPMAVFQRSSLSADSFTNSIALLTVALLLRLAFGEGEVKSVDLAILFVAGPLLALSKTAYLFLLLLFPLASGRFRSKACYLGLFVALLGSAVAAAAGWSFALHRSWPDFQLYEGTDAARQLGGILAHPLRFLATLVSYYARWVPRLAVQFVGRLGWLDTELPRVLVACAGLLLLLVSGTSASGLRSIRGRDRLVLAGVFGVSLLWTSVLLYLVVSPLGSREINGLQGRHLIPLAAPLFLSFAGLLRPIDWNRRAWWLAGAAATTLAISLDVVCRRYYL